MATTPHATPASTAMPAGGRNWSRRRIAGWIIAALVVLGLAAIFRYAVVEPREMGFACSETPQPWWCGPREIIIQAHLKNVWGIVAVIAGATALLLRQNWAIPIAIIAGLAGIVLYDTSLASLGFLLGLLRLLRS
ncbi:MAG TPA: hypothetical protein VND94_09255 [Terriglobia bacterium]|nr:hypothetical protein [Terriglobia bacterium]